MSASEVAPSIHQLTHRFGDRAVHVHVLTGRRGCVIVDTGTAATPQQTILPFLDEQGMAPDSVRAIVVTHADTDHHGGLAALSELAPNAVVLCGAADRPLIESVTTLICARYDCFREPYGVFAPTDALVWTRANTRDANVDVAVHGIAELRVDDDWVVEILPTPGHSLGSISIIDARSSTAIIADAALGTGLKTVDHRPAVPPTYRYVDEYLATLRQLEQIRPSRVLTGHFEPMMSTDARRFLEESRAFVERLDHELFAAVAAANEPPTTRELIERLAERLGDWPPTASGLLVHPLAGHLERAITAGLIAPDAHSGVVRWRAPTPRDAPAGIVGS